MDKYSDLYDFIDSAVKNRNYAENTGNALKTALNLFKSELNENEVDSVQTVRNNIDKILNAVHLKSKNKYTAGSLVTYKRRVLRAITDYEEYGKDPIKMAGWTNKPTSTPKKEKLVKSKTSQKQPVAPAEEVINNLKINRLELALQSGDKFIAQIPVSITAQEIKMITGIINSLPVGGGNEAASSLDQ